MGLVELEQQMAGPKSLTYTHLHGGLFVDINKCWRHERASRRGHGIVCKILDIYAVDMEPHLSVHRLCAMVQHIANCQSDISVTKMTDMSDLPHHAPPPLQLLLETYSYRARDQVAYCPIACVS